IGANLRWRSGYRRDNIAQGLLARPGNRSKLMEPISALVTIIAAGASSALSDTAAQAVKDAYNGGKVVLAHRLASWAGLEADPKSDNSRRAIAAEMEKTATTDDVDVLDKIRRLQAALKAQAGGALERSGVSIADVEAASDVLIKDVKYGRYFDVQRVVSKSGRIEISGLSPVLDTEKN